MINAYFLGIMLFIVAVVTACAFAETQKYKAMIHLKEAQPYQMAEAAVMSQIKCDLLNEVLANGSDQVHNVCYDVQKEETVIYITIHSPVQEVMEISYDPETKRVSGFHADR
jgi:hypothetical protein